VKRFRNDFAPILLQLRSDFEAIPHRSCGDWKAFAR
jgi:hypothetical protein